MGTQQVHSSPEQEAKNGSPSLLSSQASTKRGQASVSMGDS